MKCLLDMDGVLVDFVGGICAAHNKPNPYNDPQNHGKWEIEPMLGLSANEFWRPAETSDFWQGLKPLYDCFEILKVLEDHFGQENICILSSPNLSPFSMVGKLNWIRHYLPNYKRQYLFGPAKHFCVSPVNILVDDYNKNIDNFKEDGGTAILVPRPWNREHATIGDAAAILKIKLAKVKHELST